MRKINKTSASWNLQWRRCVMFNRMENLKVDIHEGRLLQRDLIKERFVLILVCPRIRILVN
jgi:hypothetical protein